MTSTTNKLSPPIAEATRKGPRIEFPRAFAFAIDDLGWEDGRNDANLDPPGPHRAGVKRIFDLADYQYIVDVAKGAGVRIQCLFILSELDRDNVLAKYPTTTHKREKWDNKWRIGDKQIQIMEFVREQAAYMEFGFHGTGHEYWPEDGIQRRAEWYNLIDRKPWPEDSLRGHVQAFREIMGQYGLSKSNGHSFPESFVPCAYSYYWNPKSDYSLGKLLAEAGVKYANTDFGQIPELDPPQGFNASGFDHGVHVINRNNYGNYWYEIATLPKVTLDLQYTDVIESHWPNWLAHDNFLQPEVTKQWINYYREVQNFKNRYVAKNTEQLHSQSLYKKYAQVTFPSTGVVEIDNTQMPDEAYNNDRLGNMVLKVSLNPNEHVSFATINDNPLPAYFENEGFGFLYLPRLEKKKYILKYTTGKELLPFGVYNDGTYNVYHLSQNSAEVVAQVRVYGQQIIKIRCRKPEKVVSDSKGLVVESFAFDERNATVNIKVHATDIQGNTGTIRLIY